MSKVALKTSRQGTISLYLQTSKMYHSALQLQSALSDCGFGITPTDAAALC